MEVNKCFKKLKLLLEYSFEGKIELEENQTYELIKLLENPNEKSSANQILKSSEFHDLVLKLVDNLNNVNTTLQVFLLDLITLIYKNELQFTEIQNQMFRNLVSRQLSIIGDTKNVPLPKIHLACIKLATMAISHNSGLTVLVENKAWRHILNQKTHLLPKKICDAAYTFIAKLVWRIHEYNSEQDLVEILEYILDPLFSNGYLCLTELNSEIDKELGDKLISHLSALLFVLNETDKYPAHNRVIFLLKKHYVIGFRLIRILMTSKNQDLLLLISFCLFKFYIEYMRIHIHNNQPDEFCNNMVVVYRNMISRFMNKRNSFLIMDSIIQYNLIWSNFEKTHAADLNLPLTFERNGQKIEFSLQLIIHVVVPLIKSGCRGDCKKMRRSELVEQFLTKMGRLVTDFIYSSCYYFVELLEEGGLTLKRAVAIHTLKSLLRLKGHLSKTQAGILFQGLYYLLAAFVELGHSEDPIMNEILIEQDDLRLLSYTLETMKMLLKHHHIHWYENLEIVDIQADLLNLLRQPFLTGKHIVQVLDLINICVSKFLSPNMSLLVDSKHTHDNTLTEIGKVIQIFAHHNAWEVRDSALNLLNTCTEISFIKYVPLQKIIKENNLINIATTIALTDPEFYPQCTAFICLAAATKIDSLWQVVQANNADIYTQLFSVLKNQDDGMVRKEVVNVLTGVYMNQKIVPSIQNTLYEVMLTAALNDLHWEVQLAALNFWKKAIHNQLTDRGMIDGKFPSVTFCKEKRKIIVLNNTEIQKQLSSTMDHLSSICCLTVLIECMKELHNIKVIEQAYSIAKELIDILDQYNYENVVNNETIESLKILPESMQGDNLPVNLNITNEEERSKVIDDILSENQCELIFNIHDNYCITKMEEMDFNSAYSAPRNMISADKFLNNFRNRDYLSLIEDKKISYSYVVNTLDGLLDEILSHNL